MASKGFQVQYEVREVSPEMGSGIFAKQFIPMGTLIWKYNDAIDGNVRIYRNYDEVSNHLKQLSSADSKFFMDHVYLYNNVINEIVDDGKYWNHSEIPNTGCGEDVNSTYAIRDIEEGEQLLDDYGTYEYPEWFQQLAVEFAVPQDFITIKARPGFQIDYEIKDSTYGKGIFTKQFIPANTLIWKFLKGANIRLFRSESDVRQHLESLSIENRIFFLTHVYLFDGYVNEILDDAKIWNHSEDPNTCSGINNDWDSTYAKRDIEAGEELLDDYGTYEYPQWFMNICSEYGVPQDFFLIKNKH
jgi:SET domain-containing protein